MAALRARCRLAAARRIRGSAAGWMNGEGVADAAARQPAILPVAWYCGPALPILPGRQAIDAEKLAPALTQLAAPLRPGWHRAGDCAPVPCAVGLVHAGLHRLVPGDRAAGRLDGDRDRAPGGEDG